MNIVLFGAPGCGKGSQAKLITAKYGIPQISTGDILRSEISKNTELGIIAGKYINNGLLLPDDLVIELVKKTLQQPNCQNGFILDGFPRTLNQAQRLLEFINIDVAILIDVNINEVERRALYRRICPVCGKIYNISNKYIEICECGNKLIQREDDKLEVVRHRIEKYLANSEDIIEFFKERKILATVLSGETPEETFVSVDKILSEL